MVKVKLLSLDILYCCCIKSKNKMKMEKKSKQNNNWKYISLLTTDNVSTSFTTLTQNKNHCDALVKRTNSTYLLLFVQKSKDKKSYSFFFLMNINNIICLQLQKKKKSFSARLLNHRLYFQEQKLKCITIYSVW